MIADAMDPDPSNWCKFEAVDRVSFIIISAVVVAQCGLLCLFLRSLTIRVHRRIVISPDESFLFQAIGLWFTIAFLKSALNLLVYAIFETDEQYHNDQLEIVLSAVNLFLDKMTSFCLHTILLKIPCLWVKNTVMRLDGEDLTLEESKRVDRVFKVLSVLRVYLKARVLIVLVNLAFDIYFIIDPNFGKYSKYLYIQIGFRTAITMFEAVITCFTYTFGIITLANFKNLLDFPKELERRVIVEYLLLMLCSLARLIFNVLYYFHFALKTYQPTDNCFDSNDRVSYVGYIYLSLGYATMHILPITTIILIYWPETETRKKRIDSILSVMDIKILKKKVTLASNCCLLGSGEAARKSTSTEVLSESDTNDQVRIYYDK